MASAVPLPVSSLLGALRDRYSLSTCFIPRIRTDGKGALLRGLVSYTAANPRKRDWRGSSRSIFTVASARAGGGERGRRSIQQQEEEEEEISPFTVLSFIKSQYNEIMVVDTPTSRVLLLDDTHNIHSIRYKEQTLTGSYWDEFAALPAVIPEGPIAILGLGAGTAAHIMLDLWPSLHLMGWEIDPILIDKARDYFGLSDLEQQNKVGGILSVHIGDALSPSVSVPGGFAGIVVDLFSDGKVLPELQEANTWLEIEKKLMPHGRIMVNCGGVNAKEPNSHVWVKNSAIKAMSSVFNQLSWKVMATTESENYLALTGPIPDLDSWASSVPSQLTSNVKDWKPCSI